MRNIFLSYVRNGAMLIMSCTFTACGEHKNTQITQTKGISMTKEPKQQKSTNASGLIYEIIKPATADAKSPTIGQRVTVHYTGWLDKNGEKGTKFDSSLDRGQPFTFVLGVGQVIGGWDEGVKMMHIGEKCILTIPPHLGYGNSGAGRLIPPNSTLVFEVELLSIA